MKLRTMAELQRIVGERPRQKRVAMCHGVFDTIHPGHIRHFIAAKEKADILVVSLTADEHIDKGPYRPHVPQDLRAMGLSAIELVDHVLIDPNPEPIRNILALEPDIFAKGFEYNGGDGKTSAETAAVESYGGEMLFTPGDVVFSSSKFLQAPPRLSLERLDLLMRRHSMVFDDLRWALDQKVSSHVVGDTIVDSYTHCGVVGSHGKTPTMSVRYESKTDYVGGAAIVAKHLAAAGAKVAFSTVLGDDKLGEFVLDNMSGVEVMPLVDIRRPTVNKNAIVAGGYRLLKIDTVENRPLSDRMAGRLAKQISDTQTNAVVFSDFRHGIFNRRTIPLLTAAIPWGVTKIADSQVASRWGNICDFQAFDLVTPNEREARFALGDQDSGVRPLAGRVIQETDCKFLILKLGGRGVLAQDRGGNFIVLDSFANSAVDPVGAGDAMLAYATVGWLASNNWWVATVLGAIAAGLECERDGNIPIGSDDVRARIDEVEGGLK